MAMTYTKSQLDFFTKYQISLDEVFDASGMKLAQYKEEMAEGGFLVAIGVTPCTKEGHGVRNRHGKCVQCQPACLSYGKRYHQTASVYIAYSENAKLIKIGISSDIVDRFEQLNIHQYGGFKDWKVIYSVNCESAGSVENEVHNLLNEFHINGEYGKRNESCNELFKCKPQVAIKALKKIIQLK